MTDSYVSDRATAVACLVIERDDAIRHLMTEIVEATGIPVCACGDVAGLAERLAAYDSAVVFLDHEAERSEAPGALAVLSARGFDGAVQVMSVQAAVVVEETCRAGAGLGLRMRPPIAKPLHPEDVRAVLREERCPCAPGPAPIGRAHDDWRPVSLEELGHIRRKGFR